jgi:predicted ribosome quality control (RQC) complex YloA/Tae2 family protein
MSDEEIRGGVEHEQIEEVRRLASIPRRKAAAAVAKSKKLIANLRADLDKHGDPDVLRRSGDLLLANLATAIRVGDKITVIDYFDSSSPTVEIEGDKNCSVSKVAEDYFKLYAKARTAAKIIAERMLAAQASLGVAQERLRLIDKAIVDLNIEFLLSINDPIRAAPVLSRNRKAESAFKGARRFISSDGFEILVGKKSTDNDFLTFRIAKSLDTWLHAADYPGSHVVIRSSGRREIPFKTLTEAAQVAAFYSDARRLQKATVNYTLKKFVNKPKRAAPGLVSLARFKTMIVVPQICVARSTR